MLFGLFCFILGACAVIVLVKIQDHKDGMDQLDDEVDFEFVGLNAEDDL